MAKKDLYSKDGISSRGRRRTKLVMAKNTNMLPVQDRNPTHKKFYSTGIWQKSRNRKIKDTPLCEVCKLSGRLTPAMMVHHIQPLEKDGEQLDQDNLMSLCGEYHHRMIHSLMDKDGREQWTRESILLKAGRQPSF